MSAVNERSTVAVVFCDDSRRAYQFDTAAAADGFRRLMDDAGLPSLMAQQTTRES
jgi:hypothetical protein